jgi:glycosyltransferase involved in cell wall biosynthesis
LGVHFARNRGLQLARFDLTYFTDDDMEIDPQALAELVQPFLIYPRLGLCTGRVMPRWSIQPDDWVLKYMANHNLSLLDRPEHMVVSAIDVGVYSCHEMARKQALIEAGGFHPELTGDIYVGDGESGVNAEVLRNGYLSAYISSAVTYHCIPAGRLTQAYFNKRLANQGRADAFTSFRNDPTNGQCRFLFAQCRPIAAIAKNAVLGFMFRVLGKDAWHFKAAMRHYWQAKVSHASQLRRDPELMRLAQADSYLDP